MEEYYHNTEPLNIEFNDSYMLEPYNNYGDLDFNDNNEQSGGKKEYSVSELKKYEKEFNEIFKKARQYRNEITKLNKETMSGGKKNPYFDISVPVMKVLTKKREELGITQKEVMKLVIIVILQAKIITKSEDYGNVDLKKKAVEIAEGNLNNLKKLIPIALSTEKNNEVLKEMIRKGTSSSNQSRIPRYNQFF